MFKHGGIKHLFYTIKYYNIIKSSWIFLVIVPILFNLKLENLINVR